MDGRPRGSFLSLENSSRFLIYKNKVRSCARNKGCADKSIIMQECAKCAFVLIASKYKEDPFPTYYDILNGECQAVCGGYEPRLWEMLYRFFL